MSTHHTAATRCAIAAAAVATGLLLPDPPTSTGSHHSNGTPFTDPTKSQMYRDMTRPLPFHGGNENSRCGAWAAGTPSDARQLRALHQRCIDEGWNP